MLDPKDINEILKLVDLKFNHKNFTDTFLPGTSNVPVSGKVIDKDDIKKMIEACLDGWLTTGRFNKIFEKNIT